VIKIPKLVIRVRFPSPAPNFAGSTDNSSATMRENGFPEDFQSVTFGSLWEGNMDRISKTPSKQSRALELAELSRKTGLMVRTPDAAGLDILFAELEKDDSQERANTFEYLKSALNETRASLGAEPAYLR
jgi:hypothetical protein